MCSFVLRLGQFMRQLQKLAEEFNVAVFITNQVMADPGGGTMFVQGNDCTASSET